MTQPDRPYTIDAHHHFWAYVPEAFGWVTHDMAVLRNDYLPEQLKPELDAAGVNAVISVEARMDLAENPFLLELAEQNPWMVGIVGKTPLSQGADAVRAHLEQFLPQPKVVGVRDVLQEQPEGYTRGEVFNAGISVLKEFGLRFDICILEHQLPEILEFVDRHPDQLFVLDHIAKPRIKAGAIEPWATHFRELAKRERITCKLSGMVTEADWQQWTPEGLRPYMDIALEAFGSERLMYGSDWPVCRVASEYGRWKQVVDDFACELSPDEQANLYSKSCLRAYGLEQA